MPVVPPGHFAGIGYPDFEWDETDLLQYYYFLPQETHDRLLLLTRNACLALAIGSATWVLARFTRFDDDRPARDFVAAMWAEIAPGWRCQWYFPDDGDYVGPVRGPMGLAMAILYDAMEELGNNPEIADRAAWMHNLARHVIGDDPIYEGWFAKSIDKLDQFHSWRVEGGQEPDLFDDAFPRGGVLSIEAITPDLPYDPELAAALLERLIQQERRMGNHFILGPAEHGIDMGEEDDDHTHGGSLPH